MKKLNLLIVLFAFVCGSVLGDQRFETEQGQCHFSYDINDDDNEVYFANCVNTINTYDDGGGRLAYGTAVVSARLVDEGVPSRVRQQGQDAEPRAGYTVSNTDCVMVTANYNNDGTNNYTTYATNNWYLDIDAAGNNGKGKGNGNGRKEADFKLTCFAGAAQ